MRPGGVINGFEVPFPEGAIEREAMVLFNTWGYNWQVSINDTLTKDIVYLIMVYIQESEGPQGPEPYLGEYEFGTLLSESLDMAGFSGVEQIEYSYFDSLFLATK